MLFIGLSPFTLSLSKGASYAVHASTNSCFDKLSTNGLGFSTHIILALLVLREKGYFRGSLDNTMLSTQTVPGPLITMFRVTLVGFCPFWNIKGV